MDTKLLKDKNFALAHEHFFRLCEYVSAAPLVEDDEDDSMNQNDNQQPQDNGSEMQMDNTMQDDASAQQDMSQDMNGDSQMDGENMGMEPNMNTPNEDGMNMDNSMDMDMTDMEMPQEGSDDEVIDVDDLTDAQEKVNTKVNHVGRNLEDVNDKINKLMGYLNKMETMINQNNEKIESFKAEFEKRNPTQTEKLNLRSLDSYPFNVNPKEYWENKNRQDGYSTYYDNNEPTTKQYKITNNDVDNFNERNIANSFHIDDDLRQSIEKIFDL